MSKLVCPKTSEFKKRAQSLLVVVSSEPTEIYEEFTDRVRKYNNMPPFNFSDVFANFNKVRSNKSNRLPVIYGTLLIATIGHQRYDRAKRNLIHPKLVPTNNMYHKNNISICF